VLVGVLLGIGTGQETSAVHVTLEIGEITSNIALVGKLNNFVN
jgi:hypothetical protein